MTNNLDFLKDIEKNVQEIKSIQQALVDKLKPRFKELFEPSFAAIPELKQFEWTQYTPFFNDGDSCEFSVHDLSYRLGKDWNEEDEEWEDDYEGHYIAWGSQGELTNDQWELLKGLDKAFKGLPEDTMQDLFGDHVKVIVTREGVSVEEYDHD